IGAIETLHPSKDILSDRLLLRETAFVYTKELKIKKLGFGLPTPERILSTDTFAPLY
ncbi:15361_t:CDS:2, partial [Entrophospora sp. SA101]